MWEWDIRCCGLRRRYETIDGIYWLFGFCGIRTLIELPGGIFLIAGNRICGLCPAGGPHEYLNTVIIP